MRLLYWIDAGTEAKPAPTLADFIRVFREMVDKKINDVLSEN